MLLLLHFLFTYLYKFFCLCRSLVFHCFSVATIQFIGWSESASSAQTNFSAPVYENTHNFFLRIGPLLRRQCICRERESWWILWLYDNGMRTMRTTLRSHHVSLTHEWKYYAPHRHYYWAMHRFAAVVTVAINVVVIIFSDLNLSNSVNSMLIY